METMLPTTFCGGISLIALWKWPGLRLARITGSLAQMTLCGFAMAMFAFSVARLNRPLVDGSLLVFDHSLGYQWDAFTSFVVSRPALESFLATAYNSMFWQPIVVIVALSFDRDERKLNRYITSYVLSMLFTIAIFALWPATTAWSYLGISAVEISRHHLQATMEWVNALNLTRSGVPIFASSHTSCAIVGFPSFHSVSGIINASVMGRSRYLRMPFLIVNAIMIAATPILGGHYIADIIGAVFVTVAALALSDLIFVDDREGERLIHVGNLKSYLV